MWKTELWLGFDTQRKAESNRIEFENVCEDPKPILRTMNRKEKEGKINTAAQRNSPTNDTNTATLSKVRKMATASMRDAV